MMYTRRRRTSIHGGGAAIYVYRCAGYVAGAFGANEHYDIAGFVRLSDPA